MNPTFWRSGHYVPLCRHSPHRVDPHSYGDPISRNWRVPHFVRRQPKCAIQIRPEFLQEMACPGSRSGVRSMLALQYVEHSDDSYPSSYYGRSDLVDILWRNILLNSSGGKDHGHGRGLADILVGEPAFISV